MDYSRGMMDPAYSMYSNPNGMSPFGLMPSMYPSYNQNVPQGHQDFVSSPPPGVGLGAPPTSSMLQPHSGHHLAPPPGVLSNQQPQTNPQMPSQQPQSQSNLALSSLSSASGSTQHHKMPKESEFAAMSQQFHSMHLHHQHHLSQLPPHLSSMHPQQQQQQQQQQPQQQQPSSSPQHSKQAQNNQSQQQNASGSQIPAHNMMSPMLSQYSQNLNSSQSGQNNISTASGTLQQQQQQPAQTHATLQNPSSGLTQSSQQQPSQQQPHSSAQNPHQQHLQQPQQQLHQSHPFFPMGQLQQPFNTLSMPPGALPGGILSPPVQWPQTDIRNLGLSTFLLRAQTEYDTTATLLLQLDQEFDAQKAAIISLETTNQQLNAQVQQLMEENASLKQQLAASKSAQQQQQQQQQASSTTLAPSQPTQQAPQIQPVATTTVTAQLSPAPAPPSTITTSAPTSIPSPALAPTATPVSATPVATATVSTAAPAASPATTTKPATTPATTTSAVVTAAKPATNTAAATTTTTTTTATLPAAAPNPVTPAAAAKTSATATPTDQQRYPLPLSQQQINQLQSDGRSQYIPLFTPTNIDSNLTAFNHASKLNWNQQQLYHLHILKHSGHSPIVANLGISHLFTWAKTHHTTSKLAHLFFLWFKAHSLNEQVNEYILSPTYYPRDEPLLLTVPKGGPNNSKSSSSPLAGLFGSDNDDDDEDLEDMTDYGDEDGDVRDFTTRTSTLASLTPIEYHHFYISVLHNTQYDHYNLTQMFQTLGVPLIPQKYVKTAPISSTSLIKQTKLDLISYEQHVYIRVPTPIDPQHNLPSNAQVAAGAKLLSPKDFSALTEKQFFVRPCLPILALGFIAKSPLSDEIAQNCHSTTLSGSIFDANTNQLIAPVSGALPTPPFAKNSTPTTENLQLQVASYINLPWFQSFLGIQSFFTYTYLKYNRLVHRTKTTTLSFANLTNLSGQLSLLTTQNHNFLNPLNIHFFPHFTENLFEVHIPIPPKDFGHAVHNITYCKITYFKLYFLLLLLIREIFIFTTSASAAGQSSSTSSSNTSSNANSILLRSPIYLRLCKKFIQDQYLYPSMTKFLESKELFYFILKSPFFSHNLPSTTKQLLVSSSSPLYITIFNHLRRFFIVLTKLPRHTDRDDDRYNSTQHNTAVSYPKVNEMFKHLYIPSQLHDFFHKELFTNAPKTSRR